MLINLSEAIKSDFECSYDATEFFKGLIPRITSNVHVKGHYEKNPNNKIEVNGTIEYQLEYPCSRCLEPVNVNYNLDFEEIYSNDDEDYVIIDDVIDLTDMVNDYIILNISTRVLCNEKCKGLCPICGTNLNINKCECDISIDDELGDKNPFSVLKDITIGGAEDGSTKKKNF